MQKRRQATEKISVNAHAGAMANAKNTTGSSVRTRSFDMGLTNEKYNEVLYIMKTGMIHRYGDNSNWLFTC